MNNLTILDIEGQMENSLDVRWEKWRKENTTPIRALLYAARRLVRSQNKELKKIKDYGFDPCVGVRCDLKFACKGLGDKATFENFEIPTIYDDDKSIDDILEQFRVKYNSKPFFFDISRGGCMFDWIIWINPTSPRITLSSGQCYLYCEEYNNCIHSKWHTDYDPIDYSTPTTYSI